MFIGLVLCNCIDGTLYSKNVIIYIVEHLKVTQNNYQPAYAICCVACAMSSSSPSSKLLKDSTPLMGVSSILDDNYL